MNILNYFDVELPKLMQGFVARPAQLALALRIADVINNEESAVFEAGTGTGKTLSYLIPALIGNKTVIISTGTKNLQDQLFFKDIPLLRQLFPSKTVALLKGRANYLCRYRLDSNLAVIQGSGRLLAGLTKIRTWSTYTKTGDLTELVDSEEDMRLLPMVSSTRDNCLGTKCPDFSGCALYRAREVASRADIVVVNHHLLFADLAQKEENLGNILPRADVFIVDEAHQVPDVARQFFGQRVSSAQLAELGRDSRSELALLGNDDPVTLAAIERYEVIVGRFRDKILQSSEADFGIWRDGISDNIILEVDDELAELNVQLLRVQDRSEGLAQCLQRTTRFADLFALLTEKNHHEGDTVHWIERHERGFVLHLSPLSVANQMKALVQVQGKSWIFTSATLSVDKKFDHFKGELGLSDEETSIFDSPFDYENAVRAYVPVGLPEPMDETHTEQLVNQVLPLIDANPGRTFFLFTSHRALAIAAACMKGISQPIFAQGTLPKTQLLQAFRDTPNSILLATMGFWEGVDVRGADLKCLIIDKLPFPNPRDPLFSAQAKLIDKAGGTSFVELSLPKAVISLKQGFGRLVREETDRGLFVIGDVRLLSRGYGGHIIGNLPKMRWLDSRMSAINWLKELSCDTR